MTPDSHKYVPIVRAKMGEFEAFANLSVHGTETTHLIPLFEPMPTDELKDPLTTLRKTADNLTFCWGATAYVDMINFPQSPSLGGQHPLSIFLEESRIRKVDTIPVMGISREAAYQSALMEWRNDALNRDSPICLRVSSQELATTGVESAISTLLRALDCSANNVDLIVDCKHIVSGATPYRLLLDRVPNLHQWRRLIVAGSSVSKDFSLINRGAIVHEDRLEWMEWSKLIGGSTTTARCPAFGDYTVRHPHFADEAVEKSGYIPGSNSASFRYTVDDRFLVLRGERISSGGSEQYLGQCALLASRSEYYGRGYSAGDAKVWEGKEKMDRGDISHPGNSKDWWAAMINHHITLTLNQIASLS